MRISTDWLNEFVATPPADELAHVFEMAGIGVEGVEDGVFTLEVTNNRGDWLSAIGLAREVAAMTGQQLRLPRNNETAANADTSAPVEVQIENVEDCPRYLARVIEEVRLGPSPDWMQRRLTECGMRPINTIVDVTNYVMLETGQPLHAFDAAQVQENRIVVRRARADETLQTLDGVKRALNPEVLVIADRDTPIGLAGLMGGQHSEVTAATTRVLLESAHFAPLRVRRGARSLGLSTEASRRFERWVDPNGVRRAAERAAQLFAECGAGRALPHEVDWYPQPALAVPVRLRVARCNALLGLRLSTEAIAAILERLGLEVQREDFDNSDGDALLVSVPTFRRDITREVDLIEEVARVHGYEQIPTTLPRTVNPMAGRSLSQRLEERARSALLRCGVTEVMTLSMENAMSVERAGLAASSAERESVVRLRNPVSEDHTQMRTSLIPSLLEVLGKNARHGARVFELGRVYLARADVPSDTPQSEHPLPDEQRHLGVALLAPPTPPAHWQGTSPAPADFYALKGILETVLEELGAPPAQWRATSEGGFHPGRCAALSVEGQDIGIVGEAHPEVASRYDLTGRACLATLHFDALVRHVSLLKSYAPPSRFPVVERDLALVLSADIATSQVEATLQRAGGALLQNVRTFDVYTGAPIPDGFKSLALALCFGSAERTLTDVEVEAAMTQIRVAAERELNATLR